jgi:hypothetical protein
MSQDDYLLWPLRVDADLPCYFACRAKQIFGQMRRVAAIGPPGFRSWEYHQDPFPFPPLLPIGPTRANGSRLRIADEVSVCVRTSQRTCRSATGYVSKRGSTVAFSVVSIRSFNRVSSAACLVAFLCAFSAPAHAQTAQFIGAQIPLPIGTLTSPYGVAVDGNGNIYVADNANN